MRLPLFANKSSDVQQNRKARWARLGSRCHDWFWACRYEFM